VSREIGRWAQLASGLVRLVSNVVLDANGNLYGTTLNGGSQGVGVVWEITFP